MPLIQLGAFIFFLVIGTGSGLELQDLKNNVKKNKRCKK